MFRHARLLPLLFLLVPTLAWSQANTNVNWKKTTSDPGTVVSPGNPLPIGGGFIQTARTADISATVTTSNVAFGTTANTARVCNAGTVTGYVALGVDSSITVTAANGIPIAGGSCATLSAVGYSYIAGITASSTTTLQVSLGSGIASLGGGGGGSSGAAGITIGTSVITGGTNTRVLFDDNGIIGENAGLTFTKASGLLASTVLAVGGATIGTDTLAVTGTSTLTGTVPVTASTSTQNLGIFSTLTIPGSPTSGTVISGSFNQLAISGNASNLTGANDLLGFYTKSSFNTTGTLSRTKGLEVAISQSGAGIITNAQAFYVNAAVNNASAVISGLYMFDSTVTANSGTISLLADFHSGDLSAVSGITTKYSLLNDDAGKVIQNTGPLNQVGLATFSVPSKFSAGANNLPSLYFTGDATTGIYQGAVGSMAIAIGGAQRFSFNSAGNLTAGASNGFALRGGANASSTVPSVIPNQTDLTTGFGAQAAGNVSIIAGGVEQMRVAGSGALTLPLVPADTAATDSTLCVTSAGVVLKGTGALGICLGTSGAQFKTALEPMTAGLSDIMKIDFVNYYYKVGYGDGGSRLQYGTTAQSVEAAIPDIARHNINGETINFDSGALLFVGLRAIQQLKADNDNLRHEVELLKASR